MSRIEEALEKAIQMRRGAPPGIAPVPAEAPPARSLDRLFEVPPLKPENSCLQVERTSPAASEEYRKLRTQVVQLTRGLPFRNTLLVTSTGSGEGKTITALNLAMALAQEFDYTVLLVDADLRKPSVHTYLGIEPKAGLIQCLNGEASLDQALVKTGLGKLVILPAGGTVSNPVEILSSNRMKEMIRELKSRYPERYVIFDTPPSLPFADARVLGGAVDGVLFVIREGWTRVEEVREALTGLEETPLLGVIYNDAVQSGKQGRYHYYY